MQTHLRSMIESEEYPTLTESGVELFAVASDSVRPEPEPARRALLPPRQRTSSVSARIREGAGDGTQR
eukprot:7389583-Prymnesium_polylepis.1